MYLNSTSRADTDSRLLQASGMPSIRVLRTTRRTNLASLFDHYGQTDLHEKLQAGGATHISASYLYQMAKAIGKQARGVNDDTARSIEAALTLSTGWMDTDHAGASPAQVEREIEAARNKADRAHGWPFPSIDVKRWSSLLPAQKKHIEEEVERMLRLCEVSAPSPRRKSGAAKTDGKRRAAG